MPEPLRGKDEIQNQIRHPIETKSTIETQSQDLKNLANSNTLDETEIVHLGKSFQNECSLFIQTGKKSHKTLWDSGACKCVISLESYKNYPRQIQN